eukprot:CAMPEP_0171333996 /NCGR_PEP_ID=MMETSP0878-20121228/4374_1 /TAXON_ID=67004 /ORGANISM="Thalassiosira weissflogii, Strain CCMP1336" /LENGTH=389 /DNA_ID=CAMNT_0011835025 /DNA_START=81 /DNA_END=1250 /DNA_ORIENTATION=+
MTIASILTAFIAFSSRYTSIHAFSSNYSPLTASKSSFRPNSALNSFFGNSKHESIGQQSQLSPIPKGISPFEKSLSKNIDIQGDFRKRAKGAIDAAIANDVKLLEIEFPPLLGGSQSKSQFDDFDNIQELDKNKDWTMLLAPMFLGDKDFQKGKTWLVFPDLKECELAKKEWAGQRYQEATFTTIEAVTNFLGQANSGNNNSEEGVSYDAPWGSSLMSGLSQILGGKDGDAGLLGDKSVLDPIVPGENSPAKLWFLIQPGNGGPVEDWVNCEKMHNIQKEPTMVIVNGALDKVRGGFYPAVFFPKLAATIDRFYNKFESIFYLKPFSDKNVYGWLYRVYPEPWQVVWENVKPGKDGSPEVEYVVVATLDKKPSYSDTIGMLMKASQSNK